MCVFVFVSSECEKSANVYTFLDWLKPRNKEKILKYDSPVTMQ